jgi:glycosyltransferase involved in cell wall biosynthesis
MSSSALISVIVPCYNYGRFLAEALNSVALQTHPDWECIIIDNGSTDNTRLIAESFASGDKRFKYIYTSNTGVSAARNRGVAASSGIYILPLDADDSIEPEYLEKALAVITSQPELKAVYCEASLFGIGKGKWNLPAFSMKTMLIENCIFCTALFRKVDFENAGGYSEEMVTGFEDWDFWLKLLKNDTDAYRIPEVLFNYRVRKSSRNNSLSEEQLLNLRRLIYQNHKALYDIYIETPEIIFQLYKVRAAYNSIRFSRDYQFGHGIIKHLRKLKSIVKGGS